MDVLLISNDNVLEITGLTNAITGLPIDTADVFATVTDLDGVEISGVTWPVAIPNVASGKYQGTLPDTMSIQANRRYQIVIDADAGPGLRGHWVRSAKALEREN